MDAIALVEYPHDAESRKLLLEQQCSLPVHIVSPASLSSIPPNALVLIEIRLPERQNGLVLAHQVQLARPDVVPIAWTAMPNKLTTWAAAHYKMPGLLDKSVPAAEINYWLQHALTHHAAWPGTLLTQAKSWETEVARKLLQLQPKDWAIWLGLIRKTPHEQLADETQLAPRTLERRGRQLFEKLDIPCRTSAVNIARYWGLLDDEALSPDWDQLTYDIFLTQNKEMLQEDL